MRISEVRGTAGHRGVRTRPEEPQSESASAETNGALMTFGMMWILLQAAIGEVDRRSWNGQFADLGNRRRRQASTASKNRRGLNADPAARRHYLTQNCTCTLYAYLSIQSRLDPILSTPPSQNKIRTKNLYQAARGAGPRTSRIKKIPHQRMGEEAPRK